MFRRWNQKKGAVLIVCLGILAVLTLLGISFSQLMIVERSASANYSDGIRAKFAAQSGIEYATAYLRKLARIKQHSDPGTPGDPTLPGDGWYFDPFWTDEQGRPIFDINPDPTISTILSHPPAFRLGNIVDDNSSDLYSEAYTGCVHGTYYEEGGATTPGYPGNYFQVKIQSSASQFYLNVHPAHMIGLENMLTSFIRACISSAPARTHKIPQPDGSVINGRRFFDGFSTSPGDYENGTGAVRLFVRSILQARLGLPGGIFATKEQVLQVLQDLQSGTLPLLAPWPSGTLGPEEIYIDLKNFITCQAWVDDSVLYLNPESAPTPYAGSVATHLNSFPGSTGTASATARNPDPVLAGTVGGTGPYYTFTPSAIETYYSCRELSIGGALPPTGVGTPITGRAPIDVNSAPKEVLTAVFAGLTADRRDLFDGEGYFASTDRSEISFLKAEALAKLIVDARHGVASNSKYTTFFSTFYTWDQFYGFLNTFDSGSGSSPLQLTQEQSDIIKAMVNPNTDVNKFNPDTTLRKRVDKGDIARSKKPGALPSFTTELCFGSMGYYDITSVGKVLGSAGFTPAPNSRVALAAKSEFNAVVRVYEIFRDTTQRDFETDRDHTLGRNDATPFGLPPDPTPPTDDEIGPIEVVEYPIITFPEPRDNTQINDPGGNPSDAPLRPRAVDDATNVTHDPGTYSGNIVHAAEYDGQLGLNGMVATQYYQSSDPDSPSAAGYSNAQWQNFVVTSTIPPKTGPFPRTVTVEFSVDPSTGAPVLPVIVTPPELESPPGSGEVDYDLAGTGIYDDTGFNNFYYEGYRSLVVGFNYNSWEPNAPIAKCSGDMKDGPGDLDPARFDDYRASYPLSDLVSPTSSKTMREGRNLYPLGFNPRAHYASASESGGNTYPLGAVNSLSPSSPLRRRTYLRYHNANVKRFEGGVSVWVKPNHDFTIGNTHPLHQGTVVAFRNGDPNPHPVTGAPTVSYYDPSGGGGSLNNSGTPAGFVFENDDTLGFYDSDSFMSNAFLIRFSSPYSMRAAIWGNNHFEAVDTDGFYFVEGASGPAALFAAADAYGAGAKIRSTPQVWSTRNVVSNLTGNGAQPGIRCMPGKWQVVQIWYRKSPPYMPGASKLVPFMQLTSTPPEPPTPNSSHKDFNAGNGYRFVWSLSIQDELTNIASTASPVVQPGLSSWPNGTDSTWPAGWGPFLVDPDGGASEMNGPNACYRYCSTVWQDNFREGVTLNYLGSIEDIFPDGDKRRTARSIFGAFMSSAASVACAPGATGMGPIPAGTPHPPAKPAIGPSQSPIDSALDAPLDAPYEAVWFGDAHPDWYDGRFRRLSYANPRARNLFDLSLGGGVSGPINSPNDSYLGDTWDAPGTFSTSVGNLAFATIDNFQVHPADFSFSAAVRNTNAGPGSPDEAIIEVTHLGKDIVDTTSSLYQFNDMQKRYWDAGHRYGEHAQPGHFFTTARFLASGGEIVHGVYKKYCRQIAQDAIKYGNITVGTAAFTTYSGNVEVASGWTDSTHPYDPFLARKNISRTDTLAAYPATDIRRIEYVSYLGNSGQVNRALGYNATPSIAIMPRIPYNASVRVWKDAPKTSDAATFCCDAEFTAGSGIAVKAEPDGSGGSTGTLAHISTPTDYVQLVTLSRAEAATTYISYSAGLCSETLHAVANETPFVDDVTITYLLPTSAVLQYREVID